MKGNNSRLFIFVTGILFALSGDTSAQAAEADVEQWTRFEGALTSSKNYENIFRFLGRRPEMARAFFARREGQMDLQDLLLGRDKQRPPQPNRLF